MPPTPSDIPIGLLLSGGLDSAILLGHLLRQGQRVQPFYVRSHLIWEERELAAARQYMAALASSLLKKGTGSDQSSRSFKKDDCGEVPVPLFQQAAGPALAPLVVLELPMGDVYGDHWSLSGSGVPDAASPDAAVYLPGRNALLLLKTALWCRLNGIQELALAILVGNPFGDARPEFFDALESALALATGGEVCFLRPFAELSKVEVLNLGRDLPLELTLSCLQPVGDRHCGRCNKCAERIDAFRASGMEDKTHYASGTNTPR